MSKLTFKDAAPVDTRLSSLLFAYWKETMVLYLDKTYKLLLALSSCAAETINLLRFYKVLFSPCFNRKLRKSYKSLKTVEGSFTIFANVEASSTRVTPTPETRTAPFLMETVNSPFLNLLRGERFFNKSKYARGRQICINITLLGLYLNVIFINEIHRVFYNITLDGTTMYYFIAAVVSICIAAPKLFRLK